MKITMTQALGAVTKEVKGNEEFIYSKISGQCVYVADNQPSCLIGKALHRLNVPLEVLTKLDVVSGHGISAGVWHPGFDQTLKENDVFLTKSARDVLAAIQNKQDNGRPWGVALARGVEKYFELKGSQR